MQNLAHVHDTALRKPAAGLAMGWMAHLRPFQRSASGPLPLYPTAVHRRADVQDTPVSAMMAVPAGLGVRWIRHRPPFQRSASVKEWSKVTDPARSE